LGATKLLELAVEDDEDLDALAEGGTLAGLNLDDVDRMSSRELRRALREAREKASVTEEVLAEKSRKIDTLATDLAAERNRGLRRPQAEAPRVDQVRVDLQAEVARRRVGVLSAIRGLRLALEALTGHVREHGLDPSGDAGAIGGAIGPVQEILAELVTEYAAFDAGQAVWGMVNRELAGEVEAEGGRGGLRER